MLKKHRIEIVETVKIFCKESLLSEIIFSDSMMINVLSRFGVIPGVGDDTIADACKRLNIESDFLVAIINTYANADYFPNLSHVWDVESVIRYLHECSESYIKISVPTIERHLNTLISRSSGSNLDVLYKFFIDLRESIEETVALEKANESILETHSEIMARWSNIEDQVSDLARFFIVHLSGKYDVNLCVAVVNTIFMFQKDLRQNNRLRRRILNPLLR